ncbi:MAG: hypothetical protein IT395_02495 [Candidatus Omnitrophica bacterium]|nr:hypothetical protein [Candidatus Omnitrophota bacterium]
MILVTGGLAFGATDDSKATPLAQAGISEQDLEIIRDLDFFESLPLLSEEDFNIFEEESIVESAQK